MAAILPLILADTAELSSRPVLTDKRWSTTSAGPRSAPLEFKPPRYTREQMESALHANPRWIVVYGTRDPVAAPVLRERARLVAQRLLSGDSSRVRSDREVSARELARSSLFLIGGPRDNMLTQKFLPALPVRFTTRGFRWFGRDYERPADVIHLVYPHPLSPRFFLVLVAGNSMAAMSWRRAGFFLGADDWRIYRKGELERLGSFAQSLRQPWRYNPALDHDREGDRERFNSRLAQEARRGVVVRGPPELDIASAAARSSVLLASLDRVGFIAKARSPVTITLYRSLEEKGALTRNTHAEHLEENGTAHVALPYGAETLDLWSVLAARLCQWGGSSTSRFLMPCSIWLAGRLDGEPWEKAVRRIYEGRLLPSARKASTRSSEWRSPLVWTPARALLAYAVHEVAGSRGRPALLALVRRDPPGSLDSLCQLAGVDPERVERRYRGLADSIARAGMRGVESRRPRPWRLADGFQRGVCLAHAVNLESGYLSEGSARELAALRRLGVDWISITPFGYLPSRTTPLIYPGADGGVDEESDEAICEVAARARALGLRVWLTPHLWTRGWVGEIDFGPRGWSTFFDQYRAFVLHYALLAEREGMDGLVVGHELKTATAFADRWRGLIAAIRRVYGGTLTYAANWNEEASTIAFWDALDLIGVSFYAPLAARPTTSVSILEAGATRALDALRDVARRNHRPLLLLEVGYAPDPQAPVRPWEEHEESLDLESQRACYEAFVRALEPDDWVAGVFWWKWFTSARLGGPSDASFTPRGKPAEEVLRRALRSWQGRAVHAPGG